MYIKLVLIKFIESPAWKISKPWNNIWKAHKLHALRPIRKFLTIEKAKILVNAFIDRQFNYTPLLWMFCRKTLYSKIEKIYNNLLKVIYESNYTCDNLSLQSNTVSVHQKRLRFLVTEYMWFYFTHNNMAFSLGKGPTLGLPKTFILL